MTVGDVLAAFNGTSYRPKLRGTTTGNTGDSGGTAFGKPRT
jgi:hypothetical protein